MPNLRSADDLASLIPEFKLLSDTRTALFFTPSFFRKLFTSLWYVPSQIGEILDVIESLADSHMHSIRNLRVRSELPRFCCLLMHSGSLVAFKEEWCGLPYGNI
jgi:hypothetical protein